jgi:hypothetical protein
LAAGRPRHGERERVSYRRWLGGVTGDAFGATVESTATVTLLFAVGSSKGEAIAAQRARVEEKPQAVIVRPTSACPKATS